MKLTWLHVSDFHFQGGDSYDRDVVLRALVRAVERFRTDGCAPDLIFATGDVAARGKAHEYELATKFFDDLLGAGRSSVAISSPRRIVPMHQTACGSGSSTTHGQRRKTLPEKTPPRPPTAKIKVNDSGGLAGREN